MALVHELDLPELAVNDLDHKASLAAIERARGQSWLIKAPMGLGYMVSRHEDVSAILRDRRWHSALAQLPMMAGVDLASMGDLGAFLDRQQRSILAIEGDEHARLRRLVAGAFTPRAADRLRPFMREVVGGLVAAVSGEGRCELVADVCDPYPIPIICELLGAPKEDWKLFSAWATDIFKVFNNDLLNDLPAIVAAFAELDGYVEAMIEERRRAPADDLLSALIAAEESGDRLSTAELVMLAEAVLMAGTDTTRNQLGCSVALLAEHPEQWALLARRPELAAQAVEETMRHLGAVRGTARVASEDIEYRGVVFPKGTMVGTSLAVANMDPEVYPDPHRFDITRQVSTPHMTFGGGLHYCLGASLARAELQEALPLMATAWPDLEVDGQVEWKPTTVGIWGPAVLPLRFSAASPTR